MENGKNRRKKKRKTVPAGILQQALDYKKTETPADRQKSCRYKQPPFFFLQIDQKPALEKSVTSFAAAALY